MGFPKYREDIEEARRENRAAIVNEYQYPQENRKRRAHVETPRGRAPYRLTLYDKLVLPAFILKLQSDPEHVSPELLKQTLNWTRAHYEELARTSPGASARLAMAYRDRLMKFRTPEPEPEPEPSYRVPDRGSPLSSRYASAKPARCIYRHTRSAVDAV
jgi:hypothetical protein